jgi:subtilase family serine protease
MFRKLSIVGCTFAVFALAFAFEPPVHAQINARSALPMITQPINEANLLRLFGNTRPEASSANDRGRVADNFRMDHMFLQLRRPAAQERALTQYMDQLHDPRSANFHRWLTPDQVGTQFGPAPSDIQAITSWLRTHGLRVDMVYPNNLAIDFSGIAGQVLAAFHTEIHKLDVNGVGHFANMSDPQIPAALAPTIVGIVSLHDFRPLRSLVPKPITDLNGGSCLHFGNLSRHAP